MSRAERPTLRHAPGLFETLKDDVCHVGADLKKRGWRREFGDTLGDLGSAVNRILQRDGLPNRFATLVYLVLTERSGEVRVLNGGHMPPVVVRAGALERLPSGPMALGIMADATFIEQRVELSEGDALIVFSDGVSEAMNSSGDFLGRNGSAPSFKERQASRVRKSAIGFCRRSRRSLEMRRRTMTCR